MDNASCRFPPLLFVILTVVAFLEQKSNSSKTLILLITEVKNLNTALCATEKNVAQILLLIPLKSRVPE
jgi:hypothetical protein